MSSIAPLENEVSTAIKRSIWRQLSLQQEQWRRHSTLDKEHL